MMNIAAILQNFKSTQISCFIIIYLQLTGYKFPSPIIVQDGDTYDYIVIGAGTAGSVIATRLAQKGFNIILIEAGPDAPYETTMPGLMTFPLRSHVDWNDTFENDGHCYMCQNNHVPNLYAGRMLGGTGGLEFMVYSRGNPITFQRFYEKTLNPTWMFENILPYFEKSENFSDSALRNAYSSSLYGRDGYIGVTRDQGNLADEVLKGLKQTGEKIIVDPDGNKEGFSKPLTLIANGKRQSTGPQYLHHIISNKYIAVAKNTLAMEILFNKTIASGVKVITNEGKQARIYARKEIIVSCGAIRSPQLLMLSGIGPAYELQKLNITVKMDLPVGKNLLDIVGVHIAHKTNISNVKKEINYGKLPADMFIGYSSFTEKILPLYMVVGYIIDNVSCLGQFCAIINNFRPDICNKLMNEANNNHVIISILGNLYGQSRGEVKLRSTNPKDPPKVLPIGFSFGEDLTTLITYMIHYLKIEKSDAFKKMGASRIDLSSPECNSYDKDSMEYIRCNILCMTINFGSYAGTCALDSVVDSRLMVRGVKNLRVADASVIPDHIGGTTYNTVIAIGEKAADMIIKDAGKKYNSMDHEKIKEDQIQNLPDPSILV